MATTTTVNDIYSVVCDCLLEPLPTGLSLGIVTEQDFLNLFSLTIQDFIGRSGLVWSIFTQALSFGVSQYQQPNDLNDVKVCFVAGQYIDHSTLADLDDWIYDWQGKVGTPEFWHSDGLAPKTVELALTPNYNGASYALANPADPTLQPPFGVYGLFNGATQGYYTGTLGVTGTAATLIVGFGQPFDTAWNNYYPAPNIVLSGTPWPIQTVIDSTHLTLAVAPGDGGYSFSVNIGNDGNLSMIGPTGLNKITFVLGDVIPVIPDSFCFYLAYGILARIFSTDGEAKDIQRAYYCQSRYTEGCSAAAAVSGAMIDLG